MDINGHNNSVNSARTDKVIKFILDGIVKKKFYAGVKLPTEPELCALTGVSRGCVREAVKILEASKVVEIRRGDGTYLSNPNKISFISPLIFKILLQDTAFKELCDFRESIEMAVLRLVICNCNESDLNKLRESNSRMLEFIRSGVDDSDRLYELDKEFHYILADAMKNSVMRDVYLFVFELFGPLILRNYQSGQNGESGYETHVAVLNAIETKDFIELGYAVKKCVEVWGGWMKRADALEMTLGELNKYANDYFRE